MSSIQDRLMHGGITDIHLNGDGDLVICFKPSVVAADSSLERIPEICLPPIPVSHIAKICGLVVAGAVTRLTRWIGQRI